MKAAVLTMAGIRQYDNLTSALFVLDEQQEANVLEAIQQRKLSDEGMVIIVEGYASIQKTGPHAELVSEIVTTQATGNHPNAEALHRQVIYYAGRRSILGLRVVYTTNPLKRIVYDIAHGDIQESHV
jgi:hypothetical protein